MHILIDGNMPKAAKEKLCKYGSLIEIASQGIVYDAISGHPDIFFCKTHDALIAAPNAPVNLLKALSDNKIDFLKGGNSLQSTYPHTAYYNCVINQGVLIHNLDVTDDSIAKHKSITKKIHVKQGYTRCNLIALPDNSYITSDKGIEVALLKEDFNVYYTNPKSIRLAGFEHGFFGGTCGISGNNFFICGSLKYLTEIEKLKFFIEKSSLNIIELYEGQVIDVGSILFLK